MIRKPTTLDIAILVFLAAIWGSAFLGTKIAVAEVTPVDIVFIRVAIGFVILLPWCLWRGWLWPVSTRQWLLILVIAGLNVIAPYFLISWAQQTIDAGVTALLMGAGPLLSIIAAHFATHDDKLTAAKLIGVAFGFTGVAIVIGPAAFNKLGQDLLAQGAALAGNICYVISGLLIRKVEGIQPTRLSALVLGLSTAALIPVIFTMGIPNPALLSTDVLWALLYLGIVPTGLGYLLRYHMIRTVGVGYFALGVNMVPVFGVLLGALFLGEPLTLSVGLSLIFVVTGLFIARLRRREPDKVLTDTLS
ncbi:MAG: DMT family transporter [Stappiaceae bacterium]